MIYLLTQVKMTSLQIYMIKDLAKQEGTYPIKIAKHIDEYVQILVPFGNKGRLMKRYLSKEDSNTYKR